MKLCKVLLLFVYLLFVVVNASKSSIPQKLPPNYNNNKKKYKPNNNNNNNDKNSGDYSSSIKNKPKCKFRRNSRLSAEQRLLNYLLYDYDTDARGVRNTSDTVRVGVEFLLLRIQGLDERSQVLTTTGLVITEWYDYRLTWNPEKYDNLTDIVLHPSRIWLPELALMNGAHEQTPDFKQIRVRLSYDGLVHWEPGGIFTTTCDIDIRYFPFDEQLCLLQIGAWAYYSARMNLTNSTATIQTHDFRMNGEWQVFGTGVNWLEVILPCCPNTRYPYVEFKLYLRRRHMFYIMNIILPCSLLSVLVMIVFCLPPDAGEKISLGISVLLAFTVFLLMVAENVPRTSLHIPIIVIYLTCTMALGTISVCLTVLVLNLHHRDSERKIPKWIRLLVLNYLSKLLCVSARRPKSLANQLQVNEEMENKQNLKHGLSQIANDITLLKPIIHNNDQQENRGGDSESNGQVKPAAFSIRDTIFPVFREEKRKAQNCQEWKELANVMDRLFFLIVFICMTLASLIIFLIPFHGQRLTPEQPVQETS